MQYMIIEEFHRGKLKALYERFDKNGRTLTEGVSYVNSWIDGQISVCYQVMESNSDEKIHQWISLCNDLADFEVLPAIRSSEAKAKVLLHEN